jgi:hypothetical protein
MPVLAGIVVLLALVVGAAFAYNMVGGGSVLPEEMVTDTMAALLRAAMDGSPSTPGGVVYVDIPEILASFIR